MKYVSTIVLVAGCMAAVNGIMQLGRCPRNVPIAHNVSVALLEGRWYQQGRTPHKSDMGTVCNMLHINATGGADKFRITTADLSWGCTGRDRGQPRIELGSARLNEDGLGVLEFFNDNRRRFVLLPVVAQISATLRVMIAYRCEERGIFHHMTTWLMADNQYVTTVWSVLGRQLAAEWGFVDFTAQIEEVVQLSEDGCRRAFC